MVGPFAAAGAAAGPGTEPFPPSSYNPNFSAPLIMQQEHDIDPFANTFDPSSSADQTHAFGSRKAQQQHLQQHLQQQLGNVSATEISNASLGNFSTGPGLMDWDLELATQPILHTPPATQQQQQQQQQQQTDNLLQHLQDLQRQLQQITHDRDTARLRVSSLQNELYAARQVEKRLRIERDEARSQVTFLKQKHSSCRQTEQRLRRERNDAKLALLIAKGGTSGAHGPGGGVGRGGTGKAVKVLTTNTGAGGAIFSGNPLQKQQQRQQLEHDASLVQQAQLARPQTQVATTTATMPNTTATTAANIPTTDAGGGGGMFIGKIGSDSSGQDNLDFDFGGGPEGTMDHLDAFINFNHEVMSGNSGSREGSPSEGSTTGMSGLISPTINTGFTMHGGGGKIG